MPTIPLSPQERLALSRQAIYKHMNRSHRDDELEIDRESDPSDNAGLFRGGTTSALMRAVRVWWFRHPASSAVELARPLLNDYAKVHPFKLLGVAAGAGAAAVLMRPWRMVSVGGLLLAGIKSSGLASVLLSLLTNPSQNNQDIP